MVIEEEIEKDIKHELGKLGNGYRDDDVFTPESKEGRVSLSGWTGFLRLIEQMGND